MRSRSVKHSMDTFVGVNRSDFQPGLYHHLHKLSATTDITQAGTNLIHFQCVVERAIEKVLSNCNGILYGSVLRKQSMFDGIECAGEPAYRRLYFELSYFPCGLRFCSVWD